MLHADNDKVERKDAGTREVEAESMRAKAKRLLRLSGIVWTMARTRRKQKAESISPLMNVIRPVIAA